MLRELELLPVWQLRALAPAQPIVESIQPVIVELVEEVVIEMPQVIASATVLVVSDDKKWLFVLPAELSGQAADLFNNILRALHISKTQISHTLQLTQDIKQSGASVIVAMGEIAAQQLLSSMESIENLRGKIHSLNGTQVVVTYHPNDLLQHLPNKAPSKAKTWDDLCMALGILNT